MIIYIPIQEYWLIAGNNEPSHFKEEPFQINNDPTIPTSRESLTLIPPPLTDCLYKAYTYSILPWTNYIFEIPKLSGNPPKQVNTEVLDVGRVGVIYHHILVEKISDPVIHFSAYNLDYNTTFSTPSMQSRPFLEGPNKSPIQEITPSNCLDSSGMTVHTDQCDENEQIKITPKPTINIRASFSSLPPLRFKGWKIIDYYGTTQAISTFDALFVGKNSSGHIIALYETDWSMWAPRIEEDEFIDILFKLPLPRDYVRTLIPRMESYIEKLKEIS